MEPKATRLVAIGASNLSLGLSTAIDLLRAHHGTDVEVFVAAGYGRSYGASSDIPFRRLPSILESELWSGLSLAGEGPLRALVTDVGNDILYGHGEDVIVAWVREAVERLLDRTDDITLTGLPLASIERLSSPEFLFFRTLFFAGCRLSRENVVAAARIIDERLRRLATDRKIRFVEPDASWYSLDPIHVRPRCWRAAWSSYLGLPASSEGGAAPLSPVQWTRIQTIPPAKRWLFGLEQRRPQSQGVALPRGGVLRLY